MAKLLVSSPSYPISNDFEEMCCTSSAAERITEMKKNPDEEITALKKKKQNHVTFKKAMK